MNIESFQCGENLFLAIHAPQLHVYDSCNRFYIPSIDPFLIKWRTIEHSKEHFWRIRSVENPDVHEFIIEETNTPEPFVYTVEDYFYKGQHTIFSSTYSQDDLAIQSILFYGFYENNRSFITEIILQFHSSYIHIVAGPMVDIFIKEGQFTKVLNSPLELILQI